MRRILMASVALTAALSLSACGGKVTPDTEGRTLQQARQDLKKAGVKDSNITVRSFIPGLQPTPIMTVCDHDPDGVSPSKRTTLIVATRCTGAEDAGGDPDDNSTSTSKKKSTKKKSKSYKTYKSK